MKMGNQRANIQNFRNIRGKEFHGILMYFQIPGRNMGSIGVQEE